jgi:signal transduction histidine kinase/ActR/RegA family two-component response regulator
MYSENITNETRLTRIQGLVVEVLNDLLRAPIDQTDSAIQRAIGRIGAYCRRDRSYVFVLRDGLAFNTHEWCASGIAPAIHGLQGLPWEAYGPLSEPLDMGQPFHVPDVSLLPEGSGSRDLLEAQSIRSILLVPMRAEGATYGFIGFDGVENTHAFLPGELYLLQSVADVICAVLTRRAQEQAVCVAQSALAEERAFLETVLSTSAMGIMVLDAEGVFLFANDAAVVISGVARSRLIGARQDDSRWLITKEDGVTRFGPGEWPFDRVIATGAPVTDVRFALHCPEGLRYISIHAAPTARGVAGRARVVYAMIDVTEQVRAERARTEALEEARRANALKSNFLAKMSHEMRTPLNGVLGIAEILERLVTEPDHRRMVKVLHESGSLLLGIINDLLDMSKIEADQLRLERLAFSVVELAQRIEAVHTLKAAEKRISLAVRLLGDAAAPRDGDPYRLLQILHNLISNAIKFTPHGSVEVTIDCTDPQGLRFEVVDTGIGMTPSEVRAVFEEFAQADSTIARRFGGTGLGMPIVKQLVGLMGGKVDLVSEPGHGTRVEITVPVGLSHDALARLAAAPARVEPAPDFSALRVLAADDNRTNRMILNAMLWQVGISATMVADGAAALRAFEGSSFDVVILDISMPDLDGVTVMHRLRERLAREAGRPAPLILAFTANAMSHQVEAYLEAGFDGCLTKPLQMPTLVAALRAAGAPAPAGPSVDASGGPLRTTERARLARLRA